MSTDIAPRMQNNLTLEGNGWLALKEQASMLVKSGFLPVAIKTPEQAIAIMMKGRELGVPAMQAFAQISVIQGKPSAGAELQLALIHKNCPGAKVEFLERTNERCTIEASRPGHRPQKFTYTIDDAKAAGLVGKDNWRKFPRIMVSWRCTSEMARSVFPDAIMGMSHTPEELGAVVNEEGEIVDIPSEVKAAYLPDAPIKLKDGEISREQHAQNRAEMLDEIQKENSAAERPLEIPFGKDGTEELYSGTKANESLLIIDANREGVFDLKVVAQMHRHFKKHPVFINELQGAIKTWLVENPQ